MPLMTLEYQPPKRPRAEHTGRIQALGTMMYTQDIALLGESRWILQALVSTAVGFCLETAR